MAIVKPSPLWLLAAMLALAMLGPLLAPYDPLATNVAHALEPPSTGHWFGTDQLGRDILSRVLAAARLDLAIAFSAVALAFVAGTTMGAVCGFFGGLARSGGRTAHRCADGLPALRSRHGDGGGARQ